MLKYSIKYSTKKDKDDQFMVRARLSFHSFRIEIYTGVKVYQEEWDGVRITKRSDRRNKVLSDIERRIEEIFREFEIVHKRYPSRNEFKDAYAKSSFSAKEEENPLLFTEVIQKYINEKSVSNQWDTLTLKKYIKLFNHIKAWNQELKVEDITQSTLRELILYFTQGPKNYISGKRKNPHRNTTIRRNISDYNRILRWASNNNLYSGNAHVNFEQRFKGTQEKLSELVYLEWHELMQLFYYKFDTVRLAHVRDVFCFCCFSSLRFSDVKKLKKKDRRGDVIVISTKKTVDPLVIDLNDYSREILDKYANQDLPNGLALPVISMDKTNEYLKEIGGILDWNTPIRVHYFVGTKSVEEYYMKKEMISTHAGRRTFVINALRLGISSDVIIKWTGHKDFKALKPYFKIIDELKQSEMSKFNTPENTPEVKRN